MGSTMRRNPPLSTGLVWALGAMALLALWSQSLTVPFWQDDYNFKQVARQANARQQPWTATLYGEEKESYFWRPLSIDIYWRFLEGTLGGSRLAAQVAGVALLLAASAAVGWLAAAMLRSGDCRQTPAPGGFPGPLSVPASLSPSPSDLQEQVPGGFRAPSPRTAGIAAAFVYGIHGSHFLPAVWACGNQDSMLVLLLALALRFWLESLTTDGLRSALAGGATVAASALALLSKEAAVVLPVLMLLLAAWVWPRPRLALRHGLIGLAVVGLTAAWWYVNRRHTLPLPAPYQIRIGTNVVRNALSLGLFAWNVPREALRFMVTDRSPAAAIWAAACLLSQVAGCALLWPALRAALTRKKALILAGFALIGLAPYLPLAQHCYEYYTSLALIAYAVLLANAAGSRMFPVAAAVLFASSALSTLGNHWLEEPAVLARARWGQRQLEIVAAQQAERPDRFIPPIVLWIEDEHRSDVLGPHALAYVLDRSIDDFTVVHSSAAVRPPAGSVLVVPTKGDVFWDDAGRSPAPRAE